MYKRNVKPIAEFLNSLPPPGRYYIDSGFGKLYYKSAEVAGTINTRTDASGATVIVEVYSDWAGVEIKAERNGVRSQRNSPMPMRRMP